MSEQPHMSNLAPTRWSGVLQQGRSLLGLWILSRVVTVFAWWCSEQRPNARGFISWDGAAYVSIAANGYRTFTETLFFPLFPWMSRGLDPVLPGGTSVSSVILANVVGLIAAGLIMYLGNEIQEGVGVVAAGLWLVWPAAFVTVIPYSESVATALVVIVLLALHRQQWWIVGVSGLLLTISRPTGLLILVPIVMVLWQEARGRWAPWTTLLGPPIGIAIYAVAVRSIGGLAKLFDEQRGDARRGPVLDPVRALMRAIHLGVSDRRLGPLLHAGTLVLVAVLLILGYRRLPEAMWWYSAAVAVMTFSASNLDSTERYVLTIVPLFIVAAQLIRHIRWRSIVLAGSMLCQGVYAYLTFRGRAVP